jgi:phosphoglycerol transferase MdoB-like AlkP superfamily enzyme
LFADNLPQTEGYTGPLNVHTFAGATWKSEFSIATQMRPQEFGNDGLYVFYQLKGRIKESLFTRLKALGYHTMAFYPVPGHFINARDFYTSVGVDAFYEPDALGISAGWDWRIPDTLMYEAMMKKVAEFDGPVAAMMLTINQHGPHDGPDPIGDYLVRFEQSDAAYGVFLDTLAQRGRKAGVITFGDHQPDFMANRHDRSLWYTTAYDVRCINFACLDNGLTIREDKQIDITMLMPRALKTFGFRLDGFSMLADELFKDCDHNLSLCSDEARHGVNTAFARFFD